jgi:S-adenosylmethionine/arginine decarboxylase-like enzyme
VKNDRPFQLVEQMRDLCPGNNGIMIQSKLIGERSQLLKEFQPFQNFMGYQSRYFNLTPAGEFYFNLEQTGFTGISRFEKGHVCVKTMPEANVVDLSIFLSHAIPGSIVISREIYHRIVRFLKCRIAEESFTDQG